MIDASSDLNTFASLVLLYFSNSVSSYFSCDTGPHLPSDSSPLLVWNSFILSVSPSNGLFAIIGSDGFNDFSISDQERFSSFISLII